MPDLLPHLASFNQNDNHFQNQEISQVGGGEAHIGQGLVIVMNQKIHKTEKVWTLQSQKT